MSMPTCSSCIYAQGICEKTGVKIRYSTGCTYHNPKPMTNADRVRAMTDEELVEIFANNDCGYCHIHDFCFAKGYAIDCEDVWLDWLKQEEGE